MSNELFLFLCSMPLLCNMYLHEVLRSALPFYVNH
jgi:hypothetical protein